MNALTVTATAFNLLLLSSMCMYVCVRVSLRVFDWTNLSAPFTTTAVSFLIILWHIRLLPLCILPLLQPSAILPSSIPLLLAFTCSLSSGEITRAQKLCSTPLQCSALPSSTHIARTYRCRHIDTHSVDSAHIQACAQPPPISTFTQILHNFPFNALSRYLPLQVILYTVTCPS